MTIDTAAVDIAENTAQYETVRTGQKGQNERFTRRGNPELGPLTGREKEFSELGNLTELYEGLATKTRQHVNPLADHFQVPTPAPTWEAVFADPALPLQVDVGCGSGRFVLIRALRLAGHSGSVDVVDQELPVSEVDIAEHATQSCASSVPRANVLGLEIRHKLVDRAQAWAERLRLTNCSFLFTNATVSWQSLLGSYPGPIELVTMQFPDPHFKTRHHKRRHVQPQLVQEMAKTLAPGARVFLQGDVPEAVRWMRDMFDLHGGGHFMLAPECRGDANLQRSEWETLACVQDTLEDDCKDQDDPGTRPRELTFSADVEAGWMIDNPLGVPTEREVYVAQIKAPVYRMMLVYS